MPDHKCEECGEEFESKRGLSVHKTQMHGDEEKKDSSEDNTGLRTVTLKSTHVMSAVFILGITLGFIGGILAPVQIGQSNAQALNAADNNIDPADNQPSPAQDTSNEISMEQIDMEGEPVMGDGSAPVTMVIYEDLECPFCQRFEQGAMPQIVSNYVETGQVKLVWKDLPLPMHPWAKPGAAAMECVYREGGDEPFWNVKDRIFENQNSFSESNVESKIKSYAAEEGVSEKAIQSCIDNQNPMEEVKDDMKEASGLGISGTPTSIVNGKKLVGAQPFSRFETAIESALK